MSAFAAIVWPGGRPAEPSLTARIADRLTRITRRAASHVDLPGCTLVLAPLHESDPQGPVLLRGASVAGVGEVLFEAPQAIHAALSAGPETELAAACTAYERWGARCAERLRGEYAVAIWDGRSRTLFAARDGFGIRLLYVSRSAHAVIASNVFLAAAAATTRTGDDAALAAFLAHGGAADPVRTVFQDVRVLPAGHWSTMDEAGRITALERHWTFPTPTIRNGRDDEIVSGYCEALGEAARDRLRGTATVFLSGGLDSATIAAAASTSRRLHAITAVYDRLAPSDEPAFAIATAQRLGLSIEAVEGDRYGALDHVPPSPEPIDEPTLASWQASVRAAAAHGTATFYGEAGDSIFRPPGFASLKKSHRRAELARRVLSFTLAERRLPYLGLRVRERTGLAAASVPHVPGWLTSAARALLDRTGPASFFGCTPVPMPPHPTRQRVQERLDTQISRDLAALISPELTGEPIEFRFPLLDTRVIEYVFSVPPIPWCQHKRLAREAFRQQLPPEVTDRPKTGLAGFNDALVAEWRRRRFEVSWRAIPSLAEPLREWIDVNTWFAALRSGSTDDVMAAWRAIQLGHWLTGVESDVHREAVGV